MIFLESPTNMIEIKNTLESTYNCMSIIIPSFLLRWSTDSINQRIRYSPEYYFMTDY